MTRSRHVLLCAAALALGSACQGEPRDARLTEAQRRELDAAVLTAPPAGMIRQSARFEGLELCGYTLEPRRLSHRAGARVKLGFVWRVHAPLGRGWRAFTHLTDGGRRLGNLDGAGPLRAMPGVAGVPLPPDRWPAGRYVHDVVNIVIPATAPPAVTVLTGFYRGTERLLPSGKAIDARHRAAWVKLSIEGRPAAASPVPQLAVPRLRGAIVVDGKLDEPAWSHAADTGPFVDVATGRPAEGPIRGRARLCYDDVYLYVGFEVEDATLRGGFEAGSDDPHLWERDTVELMIDPDGDGDNRDYYEIQVNPQNLVFDSRFDGYNQPRGGPAGPFGHQEWSARLDSAVTLRGTLDDDSDRDQGYVVEARVPWTSFDKARRSPPRPGDTWRVNLYAMQDNGGVAWSPILGRGNFHRAERFGKVRWLPAEGSTGEQQP